MKKFSTITMPLYDSNKANFKMDLKARFTRQDEQTKQYRDLVYVGDKYEAKFNPSIYLALSCKVDGTKEVYIGYPQFRKLKNIITTVAELLDDNKGFYEVDGALTVNPQYSEPFVINNIGQNANWISFKLAICQTEENGIVTTEPGVAIGLSTANDYYAVLSANEFWTIETILKEINLTQFKWDASLAYLDIDYTGGAYYPSAGIYQPQVGGYQAPQGTQPTYYPNYNYQQHNYNPNQGQPQGYTKPAPNPYGGYQQPQAPQPTYNKTQYPRTYQQPQAQQPQMDDNLIKPQVQRTFQAPKAPVAPQEQQMPPRESTNKPIMNFDSVEQTPVSEVDINDEQGMESVFSDNAANIFGNN